MKSTPSSMMGMTIIGFWQICSGSPLCTWLQNIGGDKSADCHITHGGCHMLAVLAAMAHMVRWNKTHALFSVSIT